MYVYTIAFFIQINRLELQNQWTKFSLLTVQEKHLADLVRATELLPAFKGIPVGIIQLIGSNQSPID